MTENEIATCVIDCAFDVHRKVGPGLLESAYENALAFELRKKGLIVVQQKPLPFVYEDVRMEVGYRIDLLIENKVIVEIKSVDALAPVHFKQALTYLRLMELKLAILMNFNTALLKDGIRRIVNNL
jgi:GxxExxY protein